MKLESITEQYTFLILIAVRILIEFMKNSIPIFKILTGKFEKK